MQHSRDGEDGPAQAQLSLSAGLDCSFRARIVGSGPREQPRALMIHPEPSNPQNPSVQFDAWPARVPWPPFPFPPRPPRFLSAPSFISTAPVTFSHLPHNPVVSFQIPWDPRLLLGYSPDLLKSSSGAVTRSDLFTCLTSCSHFRSDLLKFSSGPSKSR